MHEVETSEAEPGIAAHAAAAHVGGAVARRPMRVGIQAQRTAGNRAVSRLLQRASQAKALGAAKDDAERASQLAALSPIDLADTLLDPAAKASAASAGLQTAVEGLPAADAARVKAVLRAANGPWDEPFYYGLGLLDEGLRNAIWAAGQAQHQAFATGTKRAAMMNAALSGFVRSGALPDAYKMLNGYSMSDILDLLTYADAAGFLGQLKDGLAANAGAIDAPRLDAAIIVVSTRPVLTVLGSLGIPLEQAGQESLFADLEKHAKDDEEAAADKSDTSDDGQKHRDAARRGAEAYRSARSELERLFGLLKGSVTPGDGAAMNAYVNDSGIGAFRSVIGDPNLFAQGQFTLSRAAASKLAEIINAQVLAFGTLDPKDVALIDVAADGLMDAIDNVNMKTAAASYLSVHIAAKFCLTTFERVAKTKKVALGSEFKNAFKQVLPAPKDSSDAFKQGMEREWRPLWDQWLKTKTMPDMKREGNAYRVTWLALADQWACQPMTMNVAALYDKDAAGGPDARSDPKDPESAQKRKDTKIDPKVMLANVAKGATGTAKTKNADGVVDERVTYIAGLGKQIERIRNAVDAGWFVHVRVLSGAAMDNTKDRSNAEHSLLIVRYRGNAFFCVDMDPGNEGSTALMGGSTTLIYDAGANTFATAAEKSAMEVDKDGVQKVGFHHRYQAWSIETK